MDVTLLVFHRDEAALNVAEKAGLSLNWLKNNKHGTDISHSQRVPLRDISEPSQGINQCYSEPMYMQRTGGYNWS